MTLILQVYPILLFMLVGLSVLLALKAPINRLPLLGTVAVSFWTGALTISFSIMLAAVATGKILLFLIWPIILAGLFAIYKRKDELESFRGACKFNRSDILQIALSLPLLALMLYNIKRGISANFGYEICAFDAVGNFAMKAKLWYFTRDLFPNLLLDPEYIMFKRRYPPMIVMNEAVWAYMMGQWDGIGLKYFFLTCWISAGLLIYALVKPRSNIIGGALAAAFWFTLPINVAFVWVGVLTGYGDVPLGVSFLAASLAIGLWMKCPRDRSQWSAALLVALMLASAMWTKKEGIPFIMAAMLLLIFLRMPWRQLLTTAGICSLFLVVYILSNRGVPGYLEKDISLNFEWFEISYRLKRFWGLFVGEISNDRVWGEKLWTVLICVWIFKFLTLRWRAWLTRDLFFVAAMAVLYILVTLLTIFDFEINFKFLFSRLMLQIIPLVIVATFTGFTPLSTKTTESTFEPLRSADTAHNQEVSNQV